VPALSPAGAAALAAAQALAKKATAAATLRAYKADWTHFSQWCAAHGFTPVPAAPDTVGAYLASLAETHAPTTIRDCTAYAYRPCRSGGSSCAEGPRAANSGSGRIRYTWPHGTLFDPEVQIT
jgi:hypothetical protein